MASSSPMRLVGALRIARRWSALGLALLAVSSVRCSFKDSADGFGGGSGGAGVAGKRPDLDVLVGGSLGGAGADSGPIDPLCGTGSCIPDDSGACADGLGGAGGDSGGDVGGAAGGVSYDPGDLDDRGAACQVRRLDDCDGTTCDVERVCAPSGSSRVAEPCVSSADCKPGLACVGGGIGNTGLCRPYCCKGAERSCSDGTFCDERTLIDSPAVFVPVCIPVDDCPLTDPYPCPEGQDCACPDDRACVVVRADGATACTRPGPGQTGDECVATQTADCAYGFVCSPSAGCMKLCSTAPPQPTDEPQCPEGWTCLSPGEFPVNLGVCVGGDDGSTAAR